MTNTRTYIILTSTHTGAQSFVARVTTETPWTLTRQYPAPWYVIRPERPS